MNRLWPLLCLTFLGFLVQTSTSNAEDVRIGFLTDLSGPGMYYGRSSQVGARLAERELQEAGVPIKVVYEDSALNTRQAVTAVQKLILLNKVDSLFVDFTVVANAVSPVVEVNKKLMVYAAAAESISQKNPFAFKSYSDYRQGCTVLAKIFLDRGVRKIGVLKAETEFGSLCLEGVQAVAPDAVFESYKNAEALDAQILALRTAGVQAIINGCFEADHLNMLHAAQNIGYDVKFGAPEDTYTAQVFAAYSKRMEGNISFGLKKASPELIARFRSVEGGTDLAGYEGAQVAYLHVKQMAQAIQGCSVRSVECTVQGLLNAAPETELGFRGWKNKRADFVTVIKEFKDGELVEISSY